MFDIGDKEWLGVILLLVNTARHALINKYKKGKFWEDLYLDGRYQGTSVDSIELLAL